MPGEEPVFSERERFLEVWEMGSWTSKEQREGFEGERKRNDLRIQPHVFLFFINRKMSE